MHSGREIRSCKIKYGMCCYAFSHACPILIAISAFTRPATNPQRHSRRSRHPRGSLTGYSAEAALALTLARQASEICQSAPRTSLQKDDGTPVTPADLAIQAVVARELRHTFPTDVLVAEEDAANLPWDHPAWLVADTLARFHTREWLLNRVFPSNTTRTWVLDPIDGTAGFIRREGHAVGLALLSPVVPRIAALALPADDVVLLSDDGTPRFSTLGPTATHDDAVRWTLSGCNDAAFAEMLEKRWGASTRLCCGSLVKYAAVARGQAQRFVQMVSDNPAVWDHAAGVAVVVAAGGRVTDENGMPIEVGVGVGQRTVRVFGRTIIATAPGEDHEQWCWDVRECFDTFA